MRLVLVEVKRRGTLRCVPSGGSLLRGRLVTQGPALVAVLLDVALLLQLEELVVDPGRGQAALLGQVFHGLGAFAEKLVQLGGAAVDPIPQVVALDDVAGGLSRLLGRGRRSR